MSTKYYIKDDNGNILSTDGKTKYTLLEGKAVHDFLKTEDGKCRCFYVDDDEKGSKTGIETSPEMVTACNEQHERDRYRAKVKNELNITISSANLVVSVVGEGDIEMIETLADCKTDVEDSALLNIDIQTLREALSKLTPNEYDLIFHLYLAKKPLTVRELAKRHNVHYVTISKRHKAILNKLRKFF
jgi:RNA polymerase sigma factor (sigma-70 family)